MVRERPNPASQPSSAQRSSAQVQAAQQTSSSHIRDDKTDASVNAPQGLPLPSAGSIKPASAISANTSSLQPEFGKASPLRNPLKQPSVFNPNKGRPELHLPKGQATQKPFRLPSQQLSNVSPEANNAPPAHANITAPSSAYGPASRNGFYLPGQKRQDIPQSGSTSHVSADFFEISKPTNLPPRPIVPAPRPMFSSHASTALGSNTTFSPFKPVASRAQNAVIVIDDDDGSTFDPDAALKDAKFGSADPYMYVDPSKAGEDIKALLEGAFDDDDERPKTRLRNRARKVTPERPSNKTLSERLGELAFKDTKDEPHDQNNDGEDEEDGTVEGMAVKLLPHQVEGVSWMLDKEIGERKKNGVLPKGGILADDMGLGKTIQSITLLLTNPRPALDAKAPEGTKRKMPGKEIGKGTLVVAPLALIKQWESEIKTKVSSSHALKVLVHHGTNRTKSHLELKKYDVVVTTYQIIASEHAGSSDHDQGAKVGCFGVHWYRIILDEAHSIKNRSAKSTQACCALKSWYRWCLTGTPMQNNLDELQSLIHFLQIKPYNDLSHWKAHITGPMKNGKGHLSMKRVQYFLKAFMKRRTKDILKQEGALNFGGKKEVDGKKSEGMKIVDRRINSVVCELDDYEREFYDKLAQRANDRLQDMMGGQKTDYIGALVLLLRLRQACNHPQLIKSAMQKDKDALATAGLTDSQSSSLTSGGSDDVDDLADLLGGLEVKSQKCDICQIKLEKKELESGSNRCAECELNLSEASVRATALVSKASKSKQLGNKRNLRRIVDSDDDEDAEGGGEWLVSPSNVAQNRLRAGGTDDEDAEGGGRSLGSLDSETDSDEDSEADDMKKRTRRSITSPTSDSADSDSDAKPARRKDASHSKRSHGTQELGSNNYPSTKIRQLLHILRRETPAHKVIVFSQFTTMLDLIQPFLSSSKIPFVRYDGSLRNDQREAALHALRNDPSVRVLLCSLKCGSLGLNLTAASRVVIVEPFWNPFVEEQAIDRVHRLNQTVDVEVYKLTVSNSVEERILELQDKKRELARQAIEGGKGVAKLSMRDLLGLFGGTFAGGDADEGEDEAPVAVERVQQAQQQQQHRGTTAVPVANDARKRVVERSGRPRVEDPVYGRR